MYKGLNQDNVFEKLLCFGFFPKFLSKIFTSENFGKLVIRDSYNEIFEPQNHDFLVLPYKATRNNNAPRYLSIPHPIAYLDLCKNISTNWIQITEAIGKDNPSYLSASMIIPKVDNYARRLISWESYEKSEEQDYLILNKQQASKYRVYVDISNFFGSVYSHSVPWALIGKEKAKLTQRSSGIWYNKLDKSIRRLKNNETNGLPIGPDSSNIISEIILSQIDRELTKKKYKYLRYVDDYKCFCGSKDEAEKFIKDISLQLEQYQLSLNVKKTRIVELPSNVGEQWLVKLRNFEIPSAVNKYKYGKIQNFFDLSVILSNNIGEYAPFKYAMKVVRGGVFEEYLSYKKIIIYISNVLFVHPYMIDIFDDYLSKGFAKFSGKEYNDLLIFVQKFLDNMLTEHIPYGRSDVITLSLFMALKYDIELRNFEDASNEIIALKDPIPSLLAFLYAKKNGLNLEKYFELVNNIDQREWWLYVYELYRINSSMHIAQYKNFYDFLIQNNISFLNRLLVR
ncbi:MAG: RNA-directed DNA polymerase [Candidatus Staskawiczbacteria bacterium]|nr:RNA-directed DNA polymerase [Candidatus Staskawiczbacteria bacterium]